jgi:hypothetical protein
MDSENVYILAHKEIFGTYGISGFIIHLQHQHLVLLLNVRIYVNKRCPLKWTHILVPPKMIQLHRLLYSLERLENRYLGGKAIHVDNERAKESLHYPLFEAHGETVRQAVEEVVPQAMSSPMRKHDEFY